MLPPISGAPPATQTPEKNTTMPTRYILADPFLVDESGHCLSYIEALKEYVISNGAECVIVGNELANQDLSGNCLGLFARKTVARPSGLARLTDRFSSRTGASRSLVEDLTRLDRAVRFSNQDVFIINSLRQQHLGGVFRYFSSISVERCPYVAVVIHFTSLRQNGSYNQRFIRYTKNALKEINPRISDRFILLTDTEELTSEYKEMHDAIALTAPIPHSSSAVNSIKCDKLNVSFIGQARKDKGFHKLPLVIKHVRENTAAEHVVFHAQSYSPIHSHENEKILIELKSMGVFTYDNPLSSIEYNNLMGLSDIILLPYEPYPYTRQSSGVFAEALAAGKVIVAPRNTWMGRQLDRYATGLTFEHGDDGELANSVLRAIKDFTALHKEAMKASETWCRFHNPENFMRIVAESIGPS